MAGVVPIRCYIEEYSTTPGVLGLRLREKNTGRSVILGTTDRDQKQQFLQFLLAGRAHRTVLPGLFDPADEQDCVLVAGHLATADATTITFTLDDTLSYGFA